MPELPEVETVRLGLAPVLEGHVLTDVETRRGNLRIPFPPDFVGRTRGRTVKALRRRAKYLLADLDSVDQVLRGIPPDRELVIYCSCPNEVSAAKAAQLLRAIGYQRVRPLLGGLDAWGSAGYAIERLPADSAADGGDRLHLTA